MGKFREKLNKEGKQEKYEKKERKLLVDGDWSAKE